VDVTIEQTDGTDQVVTANSKKRDGSISAVWPLVMDSKENGTVLAWTGTTKEGEHKTFYKVTYGFKPREDEGVSEPQEATETHAWGKSPAEDSEGTVTVTDLRPPYVATFGGVDETDREAEWALGVVARVGNNIDDLVEEAMTLIVTKRRLAAELRESE